MEERLKVVFMGTPEFAESVAEKIHQSKHEIVAVVSVADKPAGRGQKVRSSAVSQWARKNDILLFQPERLKDTNFIKQLQVLKADVFVVVAFRLLPKAIFTIPTLGTFNLHASLLPQYRGAAPINRAIMNGETKSGVTTFFIDRKVDTGEILLQKEVAILPEDNAGDLHDKLMHTGADLVVETLDQLAKGTLKAQAQIESNDLKMAPKIFREDCKIDFTWTLKRIYNHIRGLSPYPAAWCKIHLDDEIKNLKIYEASIEFLEHTEPSGKMVQIEGEIKIAHPEGFILLKKVQPENKKAMSAKDMYNGLSKYKEIYCK